MNVSFFAGWPERVREERKRLGLTQEAAARQCGINRQQWGRYERGTSAFDGEPLRRFISAGADGKYIMGGVRSTDLERRQTEIIASLTPANVVLSDLSDAASLSRSRQQQNEELILLLNSLDDATFERILATVADAYHAMIFRRQIS